MRKKLGQGLPEPSIVGHALYAVARRWQVGEANMRQQVAHLIIAQPVTPMLCFSI
jgi:hypothetical protein